MVLSGAVVVILVLTFALGLLVGRQWARQTVSTATPSISEAVRKAAAPARRGGIAAEMMADRAPESTEKLTFYQTLTEPLDGRGAPAKPAAKPIAVKVPPAPAPAAGPAAPAPAPPPAQRPPAAAPAPTTVALPPASPGSGSGAAPWTIQVAAFKNRKQAEDMRQHLAASGLEAYVANIAGHDGQARFRVRIGAFKSREEAAAAADRLRGQRSLSAFVTLK
jgi:DedD protein